LKTKIAERQTVKKEIVVEMMIWEIIYVNFIYFMFLSLVSYEQVEYLVVAFENKKKKRGENIMGQRI
jgi:hypothetical protein